MNPLVSISVISYNHGPFIEKCLEGLVSQKTEFEFEILIHDDASTDETKSIIENFVKRYPLQIKPYYQEKNQYSQGQRGMNAKFNFPRANGDYIALCEGDDYWINPYKLQSQVDILEQDKTLVACFTNAFILDTASNSKRKYMSSDLNKRFKAEEVIMKGGGLFPTASLVFRNVIKDWPKFIYKYRSGDRAMSLLLLEFGDFYLLNKFTTVYRQHGGGVFNSIKEDNEVRRQICLDNIKLLEDFNKFSNQRFGKAVRITQSKLAKISLLKDKKIDLQYENRQIFSYLNSKDWLSFVNHFLVRSIKRKSSNKKQL